MKKILSCVLAACVAAVGMLSAFAFNDVTEDDFYFDAVSYLASEGLVTGYGDGSFGYDLTINRAELLTIVIRAAGIELDNVQWMAYANESCFGDVQGGQWFTQYICYAKGAGWVGGYPDNTFAPAQEVNFVEALKITMQAFGIDYDSETEPWFKGMVDAASAKNLIPLSVSAFDQQITRGEMCDLIARILKFNAGELDDWLGDKKDFVVTYDLIEQGQDMSVLWAMPDQTGGEEGEGEGEGEWDDSGVDYYNLPTDLLWGTYDMFFTVDDSGQVGVGYTDMGGDYTDLSAAPGFQSVFVGGIFLTVDWAIGVEYVEGDILYFGVNQSNQGGVRDNYIMEYDVATDENDILFQYMSDADEKMWLWGIDPVNNYVIFSLEDPDFNPSGCTSPWLDYDLYYIEIDSGDADLIPYEVPQWKIDYEEEKMDACPA